MQQDFLEVKADGMLNADCGMQNKKGQYIEINN